MISHSVLQAVTDFGDSAVISFGTFSACAILAMTGERAAALRLSLTIALAASVIALAKIYFLACGDSLSWALHIVSPSGHAALTTAFCGGLALYVSARRSQPQQLIVWSGAALAAFSISASRVALGYHSRSEIAIGMMVGCISVYLLNRFVAVPYEPDSRVGKHRAYVIATVVIVGLLAHGHRFPAEDIIRNVARHVHEIAPFCKV